MSNHQRTQRPAARVDLEKIGRVFDSAMPIISNFDLAIEPGSFVSLLGPSGCGKSTLLRLIAGLDRPDQGSVRIDSFGQKFFKAFVFQDAALLPWLSVLDNVCLPLRLGAHEHPRDAALEALRLVGLTEAAAQYPAQLSGGMKMRVSVARALIGRPTLLLLDEPFAALDENTRFRLQEDLRRLWLDLKMTTVFVTHSVSEAVFLSDRAILLSTKPARILLDHVIRLDRERTVKLRTSPDYAREIELLSHAFTVSEVIV